MPAAVSTRARASVMKRWLRAKATSRSITASRPSTRRAFQEDAAGADDAVVDVEPGGHLDGIPEVVAQRDGPPLELVLPLRDQHVDCAALAMHRALWDREGPSGPGRDGDVDEHLGLERAAAVGDGGPHLDGARLLVDRVADVAHPPLVTLGRAHV